VEANNEKVANTALKKAGRKRVSKDPAQAAQDLRALYSKAEELMRMGCM
jgi:hypothetical protein